MKYNTELSHLMIPEYGRNLQSLVEYALTLEDADERRRCVTSIAATLADLFPQIVQGDAGRRKLWDAIAMMSDYRLEVDSPYPLPERQAAIEPPTRHLPYPNRPIRLRFYGGIVEDMLRAAAKESNEAVRRHRAAQAALWMKGILDRSGRDNARQEERIAADIREITNGALDYNVGELLRSLPREANEPGLPRQPRGPQQGQRQQQQRRRNSPNYRGHNDQGGQGGRNRESNNGGNGNQQGGSRKRKRNRNRY